MTLRHLEIFLTVCKLESMTKAADELNMSQPAISMTIKDLEGFYGIKLFDRMNRKLYLTPQGETLYLYAKQIIHQYEEVYNILKDGNSDVNVRIGVNVSIGETILPSILERLYQFNSKIDLQVKINNSISIEEMIENNQLDFAIVDSIHDSSLVQAIPFYKDEMKVVMKKGKYQNIHSLDKLIEMPLILREKNSGNRNCVDTVFEVYDLISKPFIESNSDLSILELVKSGLGIGILPSKIIEKYGDDLDIIQLEDIQFIRHFYLIYSTKKYISGTIQDCIQLLTNQKK